jgi:hypothetical protein
MKSLIIILLGGGSLLYPASASTQALCLAFSPSTVSGPVGSTTEVKVVAETFDNLVAIQFPIVYDPAILEFDAVNIPDPSPLPNFFYGTPPMNTSIYGLHSGKVTLVWFDSAGSANSLAPGTLLFTIRFKIKATGSSALAIANTTTPAISIVGQNNVTAVFTNPCSPLVGQTDINNPHGMETSIAPNPFSSNTTLTINAAEDTETMIYITDIAGKICYQKNMYLKQGITGTEIACTMLHGAGMYFVHLVTDRAHVVQSIVYQ